MILPTHEEAETAAAQGRATPLEQFIYDHQPFDAEDSHWREDLQRVLQAVQLSMSSMPLWKRQAVVEKMELDLRLQGMDSLFKSMSFSTLPNTDRRLLQNQRQVMRQYADILTDRLELPSDGPASHHPTHASA